MNAFARTSLNFAVAFMLSLIAVGCSGKSGPQHAKVSGTVTIDGVPTAGLAVYFETENSATAIGQTNDNGVYELTSPGGHAGAVVGRATVRILGRDPSLPSSSLEEIAAAQNTTVEELKKKPVVPPQYNANSELSADVKPGKNEFNFDLKSKK